MDVDKWAAGVASNGGAGAQGSSSACLGDLGTRTAADWNL
jgi:hypothetical protein